MLRVSAISLPIDYVEGDEIKRIRRVLKGARIARAELVKRAIDARRDIAFKCIFDVEIEGDEEAVLERVGRGGQVTKRPAVSWKPEVPVLESGGGASRPIIVGTGPCGLFAGLLLARAGQRPVLLERGKAAGDRARDVTGFWRRGLPFDPESNVQYGEGGAGTFSDGKLYTQIRDPENRIPWLLRELVRFGAPEDILVKGRPHVGTDRLIGVLRRIRAEILDRGGEIRFGSKVVDLEIEATRVRGVRLADGSQLECERLILAPGHSARDVFAFLAEAGIALEQKPFSIGVRIEHPQSTIDKAQYGQAAGHERLGAAPYKFVQHLQGGGSAYSFCMCPGGLVVAASSEAGGVVTNGMSSYARAEANANAGYMIEVGPEQWDPQGTGDPLVALRWQRQWEQRAFEMGGGDYQAPAQLLGDFLRGKASRGPGDVVPSYEPGVVWSDLSECLPDTVVQGLRAAVNPLARKIAGFDRHDAVLTGVETRSSSPLRVLRDSDTLESVSHRGLYPAGEGAGYAGGIVSAALDGIRVAEAVANS